MPSDNTRDVADLENFLDAHTKRPEDSTIDVDKRLLVIVVFLPCKRGVDGSLLGTIERR